MEVLSENREPGLRKEESSSHFRGSGADIWIIEESEVCA